MAELAGSIIGIVSAGTKVALVLSQLASDIGSAGQEARMISSEIRTFCTILNTLKDTMDKINNSHYYAHCADMVRDMTTASVEMFTEVLNAAETLRSMTRGRDGIDGKFKFVSKVHWVVLQKPKIVVLRAAIEAYKSNIALMLGTINTVEKVARRISIPQVPDTVAEDNQERTSLQSLELDHRTSLISLEQAERQYEDHIMRFSTANSDLTTDLAWFETIVDSDAIVSNGLLSDNGSQHDAILNIARLEINSIRNSLTRSSWGEESLQDQVIRHSQRLSKLMEDDHQRLSHRWSTLLSSSFEGLIPHAFEAVDEQLLPETKLTLTMPGQEAVYVRFRTWLLTQPWSDQDKILEALRSEVYSDRLSKDQATTLDTVLAHSRDKSNDKKDSTIPWSETRSSPWTQGHTPLARAISEQAALEHAEVIDPQQAAPAGIELDPNAISSRNENIIDLSSEAVQVWIRKCTETLDLSWNCIRRMPHNMSLCTNLRRLDLGHNHLEIIPQSLLYLEALVALDLRGNRLHIIPSAISRLTALQVLFLSDNKIQGLPLAIGRMKNLQILELQRNPIVFPSANVFFDMRRSLPRDTSLDKRRYDAASTAQLKSYLKCFPSNGMIGTQAQAVGGNLSEAALQFELEAQARSMAKYKTIGTLHIENEEAISMDEAISFVEEDTLHQSLAPVEVSSERWADALLSPRIILKRNEDESASHPAERHEMNDHRRSRSHDVSSHRGTFSTNMVDNGRHRGVYGSLDVGTGTKKTAGASDEEVDSSWASFVKTIPEVMLQKRESDWQTGPTTAPIHGMLSPVSPSGTSTNRPESYSGKTSRKEKRYSMMFS